MIRADDYCAFKGTIGFRGKAYWNVAKQILSWSSTEDRFQMIKKATPELIKGLKDSSRNGELKIVRQIFSCFRKKEVQLLIKAESYAAMKLALRLGHWEIFVEIYKYADDQGRRVMNNWIKIF